MHSSVSASPMAIARLSSSAIASTSETAGSSRPTVAVASPWAYAVLPTSATATTVDAARHPKQNAATAVPLLATANESKPPAYASALENAAQFAQKSTMLSE